MSMSGHPLPPPQGAVYTIQWSDCKHGAKQFWHSLRLPDWIFLLSFCFSWRSDALWDERNWVCPVSWTNSVKTLTKHNNSTTLQSKLDIVCTPRLCPTTCALVKSQCPWVAWGVQGVFGMKTDRRWLYEHLCTEDESTDAASVARLSGSNKISVLFFCCCDRIWKRPRRSRWKQTDACTWDAEVTITLS